MPTNQALQRLAARPPLDLTEADVPIEPEDDLMADVLDFGAKETATDPILTDFDPDLDDLPAIEHKDDSPASADPGALQGPLQGDPSKGGALSSPGVRPAPKAADKKKAAPARKPPPRAAKRADKKPAKDQTEKAYIAPKPPAFWNRRKVGISITKDTDGRRLMLMVTSNSYKDREAEAVATKALKEYVDTAWARVEGKCIPQNTLQFWHGGDIGDTVWCDTEGPFLLEVHKERPNQRINIARKGRPPVRVMIKEVWDYLEANPDNIEWGASHGFEFFKRHKSADNTYQRIYKFESSVLPLQWAANPYTFSGVVDMEPRDKLLNQMVGERTGKAFRKGVRDLNKVLADRGLRHKERAAEKGLLEDIDSQLDDALSTLTDDPAKLKQVKSVILGLVGDGDEDADPLASNGTEEEAKSGYRYASLDDEPDDDEDDTDDEESGMSSKGLRLLDTLIDTQAGIYEGIEEIAARQKALDPLIKLPTRFDGLDKRLKALETQLKMRPQSASESDDTEIEDPDLIGNIRKQMANFDNFFGVHIDGE